MDETISGLFKGSSSTSEEGKTKTIEVELRLDVDGKHPLNVMSGDIYSNFGKTRRYLSSFRFQKIKKTRTASNEIKITGKNGNFHPDSSSFSNIQVIVPMNSNPLKATVQWINNTGAKSNCECSYESKYFRKIQLEHDYEEGTVPFEPYETAHLFSPLRPRSQSLSIVSVFGDAGIEITIAELKQEKVPRPKVIPGEGSVWTDAELQDAMIRHFDVMNETLQWKIWLLTAHEYVMSNTKGITIVHKSKKRIGCALFQNATGWESAEEKRVQFFIYIHELGHCLNLRHPWNRPRADFSREVAGYSTLSWMNYPWRYYLSDKSHGEEAFWKAFHFQFSDSELMHLRHGFRNDVVFGENTNSEES